MESTSQIIKNDLIYNATPKPSSQISQTLQLDVISVAKPQHVQPCDSKQFANSTRTPEMRALLEQQRSATCTENEIRNDVASSTSVSKRILGAWRFSNNARNTIGL